MEQTITLIISFFVCMIFRFEKIDQKIIILWKYLSLKLLFWKKKKKKKKKKPKKKQKKRKWKKKGTVILFNSYFEWIWGTS